MPTASPTPLYRDFQALLLDIEGTITPIDFVYQTLFPYARQHVRAYIETHATADAVRVDIDRLRAQHRLDASHGLAPPAWNADTFDVDAIEAYIHWLMDRDSKLPALKSLQGKVWEAGYTNGTLRSAVYDDVIAAFNVLTQRNRCIHLYSSGSVLAQKLLIAHSKHGDLRRYIAGYFDTTIGAKTTKESYQTIAAKIGTPASEVLFISDIVAELDAAQCAGMQTLLSLRPGNAPQTTHSHPGIHSFDVLVHNATTRFP